MAYIAPDGVIWILQNCPLDNTYEHTIYFATAAGQQAYFLTLRKHSLTTQSYSRVGRSRLRVEVPYENLYDCNYVMFKNQSYENKWFYAFITEIQYINNSLVEVEFEVDVMQTFMFDYQLQPCFVEREHALTDAVGDNILPEPVALGEYVFNGSPTPLMADNFRNFVIVAIVDVSAGSSSGGDSGGGGGGGGGGDVTPVDPDDPGGDVVIERDITGTLQNNLYHSDEDGRGIEKSGAVTTRLISLSGIDNFSIIRSHSSAYNCFYDSSPRFISSFSTNIGETFYGGDSGNAIPSNAAYLIVSNDIADAITVTTKVTVSGDDVRAADTTTSAVNGHVYDGIYGAASLWAFRAEDVDGINAKLNEYKQKPESVVSVYTCNSLVLNPSEVPTGGVELEGHEGRTYTGYLGSAVTRSTTVDGHSCRNSKLLTYPYNFLHVDNVEGESMELRYEFCADRHPQVNTYSSITQPVEVIMHPRNYKGSGTTIDVTQGIRVTNFPLCSWAVDAYQAWIAQNHIPMGLKAGSTLVRAGATGLAFGIPGMLMSAVGSVADIASQVYEASIAADVTRGSVSNGSSTFGHRLKNFYYVRMSITRQHAEMIDDFFDKFGYTTNRVKQPNISGRRYWNYVKTKGAIITGKVPNVYANKICKIFDHGITFWKSGNQIGNYSLDNRIA